MSSCSNPRLTIVVFVNSAEIVGSGRFGILKSYLAQRLVELTLHQILCDKTSPWSSCQIAHLSCGASSDVTPVESHPTADSASSLAQPALISSSEEDNLSLIRESLTEIKDRPAKLRKTYKPSKSPFEVSIVTTERNASSNLSTAFQNEPSFNNQSAQASISAELSAEEANINEEDQEIQSSLASLNLRLQAQSIPSSANNLYFPCSSARPTTQNIGLPPVPVVPATLRKAAGL